MGERCPVCGATSILFDPARGEYYCPVCGHIYCYEEVPAHHDIIQAKHDVENAKFELRKATDDDYNYAVSEIMRIAANLNLPSYIVREAERMYIYLMKNNYVGHKYNTIEALAPALILLAAKRHKIYIKFFSVVGFAKASKKEISLAYKRIKSFFENITAETNTIEGDG